MSAKLDTEQFRYLMTTMSVIISLAITTVLRGLGQLIPARIHVKLYFPHFCYPILLLIVLVEYWWGMWEWRSQEWQFWPFLFALISPSVLYLVTVLILPDVSSRDVDLKAHYFDYRPWFFSLAALAALLNIFESLLFPPHKLLLNYNLVRVAAILVFIVAAYSANERLHELLPFVLLVLLVIFRRFEDAPHGWAYCFRPNFANRRECKLVSNAPSARPTRRAGCFSRRAILRSPSMRNVAQLTFEIRRTKLCFVIR